MSNSQDHVEPETVVSGDDAHGGASSNATPETVNEAAMSPHETLRWWPAAVLLIAMIVIRSIVIVLESPSLPLMIFSFMGPAVIGLMLLGWWFFASRASWGEKFAVLGVSVVLGVGCCFLLHPSLKGMGIPLFVLPTGVGAVVFGLIVTASKQTMRLPATVIATLIGFGGWALLQIDGFNGKFKPSILSRWSETSEDAFLAEMSDRQSIDVEPDAAEYLRLADAEWPGFRGRDRMGSVSGVSLSEDWSAAPPKEVWRTPLGPAWSSFSVAGKRLFTQEQRGEMEAVVCLDADSGAIIWEYETPSRFWEAIAGAGPRATPTIDEAGIYSFGADGILVHLDAASGEERWKRDLKVDAGRKPPTWGFAASPLVTDSLVIVHVGGGGDKGVLAFDKLSGEPAWSAASGNHSYSSAQLATFDGVVGLLMLTNDGLQFLDASDGSVIWNYPWKNEDYRVVQPYVMGESVVIGGSLGTGTRRIRVTRDGESWSIEEEWTTRDLKPDYNDFVVYEGYAYGFDSGIFACIDLETGDREWKRGRYGNGQVLLLEDKGQLLIAAEQGDLVLARATPEKLDQVAKLNALDGKTWNHPVLIGNRLYVRNAQEAACYEMPIE
ncbi:MAG: PQQ-binding-like beta-propeller repeat protein [Planctomycetota bacterium]